MALKNIFLSIVLRFVLHSDSNLSQTLASTLLSDSKVKRSLRSAGTTRRPQSRELKVLTNSVSAQAQHNQNSSK